MRVAVFEIVKDDQYLMAGVANWFWHAIFLPRRARLTPSWYDWAKGWQIVKESVLGLEHGPPSRHHELVGKCLQPNKI